MKQSDQVSDESVIELVREAGGRLAIPLPGRGARYVNYEGVAYNVNQLKRICRTGRLQGHTQTEAHWDGPLNPRGYEVRGYVIPLPPEEVEANVQRSFEHWRQCRAREQEPGFRGYPSRETEAEAEERFRSMPGNTHACGPTGEFRPARTNKGTLVFWVVSLP